MPKSASKNKLLKKQEKIKQVLDYWTRYSLLPQNLSSESAEYQQIIASSAVEIQNQIIQRKWTAERVIRAFCHRALDINRKVNCLTEILFERAIKRAQKMDEEFRRTGQPLGPLHGVPISVKDHVDIQDFDTSIGYTKFALRPCTKNALVVELLEAQGAIVFVKTNVPQTLMTFECVNPIFGRTLNPYNEQFGPGGSSGGEAALIASLGSCLGVGSDLGGSLRIPSHCCGIYAFKPSFGRISIEGNNFGFDGRTHLLPTLGPMARNMDDLELFMSAVLQKDFSLEDQTVLYYKKFSPFKFPKDRRLRIGFYTDDGYLYPAPACARAVQECVTALEQAGHELVPFYIPEPAKGVKLFYQWAGADGLKTYLKAGEGDPVEKSVRSLMMVYRIPLFIKKMVGFLLRLVGQKNAANLLGVMHEISVEQLYQLQHEQHCYFDQVQTYWKESEVDFVIAPGFAVPAPPHDCFSDTSLHAWSTCIYNLLNYSVGAVPVTKVKATDTIPPMDAKRFDIIDKLRFRYYDPAKSQGLPVGVQVIGGYRQDERTLAAMRVVDEALKQRPAA